MLVVADDGILNTLGRTATTYLLPFHNFPVHVPQVRFTSDTFKTFDFSASRVDDEVSLQVQNLTLLKI